MKIAIVGTRGIPNHYGGFEQFAEYLSQYLVTKGHDVTVYCSSLHPYQEQQFKGVRLIHMKDWEDRIGTAGQFIYDLNCILNARKHGFDVLLQLGYTSSSIWMPLIDRKSVVVTNMDGLEWRRSKYNQWVRQFLKFAEKIAAKRSDYLVADSLGINNYLLKKYCLESTYIPYGANTIQHPMDVSILANYDLVPFDYDMLIARMEPENNIEMILQGFSESLTTRKFIVIGNVTSTSFGRYLLNKYRTCPQIVFLNAIYDINKLDTLRNYSNYYFHGHSVGGTNPSLLEAMASGAFICAHDNEFNKGILKENALYFSCVEDVIQICNKELSSEFRDSLVSKNRFEIETYFSWNLINQKYLDLIELALVNGKYKKRDFKVYP